MDGLWSAIKSQSSQELALPALVLFWVALRLLKVVKKSQIKGNLEIEIAGKKVIIIVEKHRTQPVNEKTQAIKE